MSSYTMSQVDVFKERNDLIPDSFAAPLRPVIVGGHAHLMRYDTAAEKTLINLGAYSAGADTTYDWPGLPTGALVDLSYARLFVDDALLRYHQDDIGSGDTIAPVSPYKNRIRAAATVLATANGSTRNSALEDRDVQVGDVVHISDGSNELTTTVAGLVPEVVAASVGSASSSAANLATQTYSATITQTAGTANDVTEATDSSRYDGLPSGNINEVYTITVIQAPTVAGNATTALLKLNSASGTDEVASFAPSAYGSPTRVGTRGAEVTWSNTSNDFVVGQVWTLTIAQAFTAPTATSGGTFSGVRSLTYLVTVSRGGYAGVGATLDNPTTQATATATGGGATGGALPAGDYYIAYTFLSASGETMVGSSTSALLTVGATNIPRVTLPALPLGARGINIYLTQASGAANTARLYKRNVTTTTADLALATYDGLAFANSATLPVSNTATLSASQITVVDVTGEDASGPTDVPLSSAVAIGTKGVTISFSQSKLRKNDVYLITGTAASDGAMKTIVLSDNMSTALAGASDLALKLYIKQSGAVAAARPETSPDVNWLATRDDFTVYDGMTTYADSWTVDGVPTALPVESGTLYIEYRAWLDTYATQVYDISDPDGLEAALGVNHPDNPLCYAVGKALTNANEQVVRYSAIADPDVQAQWTDFLAVLDGMYDVYDLVPLTRTRAILDAYAAHVTAQSADTMSSWRNVWCCPAAEATYAVVDPTTTSDDATAMGTLADNPSVTGTQYTLLSCTTANAKFVTNAVRAGDVVRFLYGLSSLGEASWTEFPVASVVNEDQLVLATAYTAAVSTAQRFEVWRTRSRDEQAAALAATAGEFSNSRAILVWPDTIEDGSYSVPGYFLAAAMSALAGAVAPHQPLRNVQVTGFTGVTRSTAYFSNAQLRTLEAAGYCTVSQESDGTVFVRRARTSDQTSVETGEESSVRSLDAIRYALYSRVRQFLGRSNISDSMSALLRSELTSVLEYAKNSTAVERLGSLVTSYTIDRVSPHAVFPDVYVVAVTVRRPVVLNDVQLVMTVSA